MTLKLDVKKCSAYCAKDDGSELFYKKVVGIDS
jgi:hypothetical protein